MAQTRSQLTYGWIFSPYSDENGLLYDNENIATDWGWMWEDYDNNYFSISIWSDETAIDVRAGDHLKVWYDDSAAWVYFTGAEDWEQARIGGEEGEIGGGGFEFYVDVDGNTYYDAWCCQTAYYNTAPTPIPTPTPPPIMPYALWHMDTCTEDWIYDSGPSNRDGEIQWATWTTGLSGCALDFDGVDDYVDIINSVDLESFTLSAWVWGRELGRCQRVLNGSGAFFNFRILPDDAYQLELWDGSIWTPVTTQDIDLTTETWNHMATTYNHNTYMVKIYVNGIEAEVNISSVIAAPKSGKLWIGGHQPNEYFNGIIDEVSVYDEVLSAAAIWDLYFHGLAPTPTP